MELQTLESRDDLERRGLGCRSQRGRWMILSIQSNIRHRRYGRAFQHDGDAQASAAGLKAEAGTGSHVMVDYLQLMTSGGQGGLPDQQEICALSRNLKLLARELDCPVIWCCRSFRVHRS